MVALVSSASYALAAALFLALTALLLTAWRGRLLGGLLLVASMTTVVWAGALAIFARDGTVPLAAVSILEVARGLGWLLFLRGILQRANLEGHQRTSATLFYVALTGGVLLSFFVYSQPSGADLLLQKVQTGAFLGLSILGLAFVEQIFRGTRREDRWQVKFLCIGLGGQFAYDLFLYSNALLFGRIDPELWAARGLVQALVVPFLALTAVRNPEWSVQIFVSRHVVFGSMAVAGAGVYLLVMAAAGYYIRLYGGSWGRTVEVVFLSGAIALLAVLLSSQQVRSRAKVLVAKHFFRNKHDYRETWLNFTQALSAAKTDAELRESVVEGIAVLIGSPAGAMWTGDQSGRYGMSASWGYPAELPTVIGPDAALVEFLTESEWILYVDECIREPAEYGGIELPAWVSTGDIGVVVPLKHQGELLGFVGLANPVPRRKFDWEDTDLLKTVGRQAAGYLAWLRLTQALADAKQFDAFNRLSSYVVHDLKNLAAQLSLVVRNSERHLDRPEFVRDAIDTVANASGRMQKLLDQLRKGRLEQTSTRFVNVGRILRKVVTERSADEPKPIVDTLDQGLVVQADAERLHNILGHVVQNAQDATPASGEVRVRAFHSGDAVCIEVRDTGSGMDPAFIAERLFRPFQTTKGNAGMGIGVYETREYVNLWGGTVDVDSEVDVGTCFRITLPTGQESAQPQKLEAAH